ncbi:LPS-assembly protein LptD [Candidatus Nitronereus thalassa]|uniref:LPS assembly protein LptD n=1 Tax=Candidatus Nitronereus thalassa TaxID=3020898 RepID=A0ABU3K676_9BACT|nr:LPS assembly protein LptD [Candidatus Nitronereus thalassa]MDT7041929.1 LPS assembly protein LptD [Candidatus Nitronereus thalassa]
MILGWGSPISASAQPTLPVAESTDSTSRPPLDVTAERVEFDRVTEVFRAVGSVIVTQGPLRLTADEATIHKLSGALQAKGAVHLNDQVTEVWADEMEINVYTEAGVITNGKILLQETNTWVRGRLLQRFSETHFRAKDGTFTNCDADDGQIPDWSFAFADIDLEQGDSLFAKNVWFQIRNQRILPLPMIKYPMPGARKTGFLLPTAGFDNVLGFQYRQDFFWAISPSQDLLVTPQILTDRGFGGDLAYRYIINRRSKGNWLLSSLYDTDLDKGRAQITGAHVQQVNEDLFVQMNVNYATDRTLLQDLTSSGVFRSLPSQESIFNVTQRLPGGSAYLKAQYLQPLNSGGRNTFQRLPEIGHGYTSPAFANEILVVDMNSNFVHFWREQGFHVSRLDVMPGISTQGLHLGNVVGLRPQMKLREVVYSHGRTSLQDDSRDRGTFWLGFEAFSNLSRRFPLGQGHRLRHTVEPRLFYEFVPDTKQSDLLQIDAVDNLIKKNLVTYSVNTRLKDERSGSGSTTLLDLFFAQSYHLGGAPGQASNFSDMWGRAIVGLPRDQLPPSLSNASVSFDAFFNPGDVEFSQFNTNILLQASQTAYIEVGHRHTRAGTISQRGDIWNPLSFNEVLAPQSEINFLTLGGAVRTPFGWTAGSKVYHDFAKGQTPEWDVVGLYQNPCRCWSLGLYYIRLGGADGLPERNQFNFVLTLRGIGATQGNGTALLQSILGPLLGGEVGVPWSPN